MNSRKIGERKRRETEEEKEKERSMQEEEVDEDRGWKMKRSLTGSCRLQRTSAVHQCSAHASDTFGWVHLEPNHLHRELVHTSTLYTQGS